jgi:hypothetical protein
LFGAFRRKSRGDPRVPPADERRRILNSVFLHFEHRTGADLLMRSSAVSDNQFVAWQLTLLFGD